tara:strand:+ start:1122 stop:1328 length:207 start_codon:yes stop_codon:yes gene_type:complete
MRTLEVHYSNQHRAWAVEAFDGAGYEEGQLTYYDSLSAALHYAELEAREHPVATKVNQWSPITGVAAE